MTTTTTEPSANNLTTTWFRCSSWWDAWKLELFSANFALTAFSKKFVYQVFSEVSDRAQSLRLAKKPQDPAVDLRWLLKHQEVPNPLDQLGLRTLPYPAPPPKTKTTHACLNGYVYLGYTAVDEETGEEVERVEVLPCRRCAEEDSW
jgi:hypothetical protein